MLYQLLYECELGRILVLIENKNVCIPIKVVEGAICSRVPQNDNSLEFASIVTSALINKFLTNIFKEEIRMCHVQLLLAKLRG